ncbi:ArnT family glycosyltransferase [Ancylobacter sp.]|uniref:ArnT family glycosyltransferase n=1 Tax=Ancylobacter sp. TaxID=1872567 RepID=UPI003D15128C
MKSLTMGRKGRSAPLYTKRGPRIPDRIVELFDHFCRTDRRACLFLVLLCLVALLPGFFSIPPVDRDGARFALTSRHMVETGDLTETRLGWETKRTRALGLHWLQAGVVKAAQLVGVPQAPTRVWLYRLPSLAAAIAAVLLTYWAALAFAHRRAAVLAASLLASSVALGVGGRLAVPEVFLLASVAAMIGATGRLYLAERQSDGVGVWQQTPHEARLALIFWAALAFGLFTKGLMTPVYVLPPLLALVLVDRSARFLQRARSYSGLALLVLVAAGWFLLRRYAPPETQAEFVARTMLGPVAADYQGFTGLPGVYLLLFFALFWPAAPLAALAAPFV